MHFKMKFVKVPTHHFNKNLFVQKSCDALIGTWIHIQHYAGNVKPKLQGKYTWQVNTDQSTFILYLERQLCKNNNVEYKIQT